MTMKCPNCGAEFVDGNDICTDCRTPLVKKKEKGNDEKEFIREGVEVEKLTSVSDHLEVELLQGILENHGIPSYSLDQESGGYMRVYMGYSIFGEDIYVRASDFAAAKECLEEWESVREGEPAGSASAELDSEDGEENQNTAGGNPLILKNRHVAALIILIAAVLLGIIGISPHFP